MEWTWGTEEVAKEDCVLNVLSTFILLLFPSLDELGTSRLEHVVAS